MAERFSRSLLKVVIAQICQSLGWQAVQTTPCDLLTDILERYIEKLAETTHRYAEQYNRTQPNLQDISHAFRQIGISLGELEDYTNVVEHIPFAHDLPNFPFPKSNALNHPRPCSSEHHERLTCIPDYLPPLLHFGEDADEVESSMCVASGSGIEGEAMDQTSPRTPGRGDKRDRNSMLLEEPSSKRLRINEDGTPQELTAISMTPQGVLTPKREGKLPDATTPPQSRLPSTFVTSPSEDKKTNNEKAKDENMCPPPAMVSTSTKSRPKSPKGGGTDTPAIVSTPTKSRPKSPKGGGNDTTAKPLKIKDCLLQNKPNSPKGGSRTAKSPERSRTGNKKSPSRAKSPAKQTPPSPPAVTTPILTGLLSNVKSEIVDDIQNPSPNDQESKLVPASDETMDASIQAVILRAQQQIIEQDQKEIKEEHLDIKEEKMEIKKDKLDKEDENRLTSVDNTIESVIQRSQQQFAEEEELKVKLKEQKAAEPPKPHDPYDFMDDDSPAPPVIKETSPTKTPIKKLKKNKEQERKIKVKKLKIKEEKQADIELKEKSANNIPVVMEIKEPVKDKSKKKDKKEKKDKHKEMKIKKESVPIPKISIKTTTLTFSGLDFSQSKSTFDPSQPPIHKISTVVDNKTTTEALTEGDADQVDRHHDKAKKKKKEKSTD